MPVDFKKLGSFGTYDENEDVRTPTDPVSEGPHNVFIIDISEGVNSNGDYMGLRYKVFGDSDPDNSREFTDFFTLNEENRGFPNDMKRLNTIAVLNGLSNLQDIGDLRGKAVTVQVAHRTNKASGRIFPQVASYSRCAEEPPEDVPF